MKINLSHRVSNHMMMQMSGDAFEQYILESMHKELSKEMVRMFQNDIYIDLEQGGREYKLSLHVFTDEMLKRFVNLEIEKDRKRLC